MHTHKVTVTPQSTAPSRGERSLGAASRGPGYCTALSGLLRPGLMGSTALVLGAQLGEVPGEKISSHT